jgi:hypothetical protein
MEPPHFWNWIRKGLVWCAADNYSVAGPLVAAAFRPPPVRAALNGEATSRSADITKDIRHGKEPLDAPH